MVRSGRSGRVRASSFFAAICRRDNSATRCTQPRCTQPRRRDVLAARCAQPRRRDILAARCTQPRRRNVFAARCIQPGPRAPAARRLRRLQPLWSEFAHSLELLCQDSRLWRLAGRRGGQARLQQMWAGLAHQGVVLRADV